MATHPAGPKRILVADDNAYYLTIISDALTEAGYEVIDQTDGFLALKAIEEMATRPIDLAILNRELPGLNGMEVIRKARQRPDCKHLIMLLMDVFTKTGKEIEELKRSGASGYFNKSISIEEIVYRLNDMLFPPERFSRKNPRAVIYVPVVYRVGDRERKSYTFTLSADGMYIQSMAPEPPRTTMELHFKLGDGTKIRCRGRVIYRYKYDPNRIRSIMPGMAIRFLDLPRALRKRLNDLVVGTLVHSVRSQDRAVGGKAQRTGSESVVTCRTCTGLGKITYLDCHACKGSGEDCSICHGTGRNPFIRKVCPICRGVGSIQDRETSRAQG